MIRIGMVVLALGFAGCGDEKAQDAPCQEASGVACVWAGTGELGMNGDGKDRLETRLYWPIDLEFAPDGTPYVLDWNNHLIRRVNADDTFETVVGDFFVGDGPPDQSDLTAPGADGLTVSLNHPTDIQFDADGLLYFSAWHNHKIRRLDPETGLVFVIAGRGGGFGGDGGPTPGAVFNQPKAIVLDGDVIYVLDQRNFRIRRLDLAEGGLASTAVGVGTAGFGGDGGPVLAAQLNFEAGGNPEPSGGLTMGPDGALYVSDGLNHRIRRIDLAGDLIETIAGTGEPGYSGDGGPAVDAQINNVRDLEFGPDGRLYLADSDNNRIRAIDLESGTIETVVGTGEAAQAGETAIRPEEDGLPMLQTAIARPFGLAFDEAGDMYVADSFNSRILRIPQ